MNEKMFGIRVDDIDNTIINITRDGEDFAWFLSDIVTDKQVEKVVDKLNEQQSTIDKLDQENADLLGARIKAQEEWEKCTDKLKAKILEQQATITKLNKQIEQLHLAIDDLLSHTSCDEIKKENEQLRNKLEVANARSGYYQRMLEKWCVKDE